MSPRDKGRRTIGAWIEIGSSGFLRICFRWPARRGRLYRITTELHDTVGDRRELERVRDLVGAEIRSGIFDPVRRFPSVFARKPVIEPFARTARTVADEMRAWIGEKKQRKVRPSRIRDYESHLKNYVEPAELGALAPEAIGRAEARAFQLWLVSQAGAEKKGVSEKTAQNVVRGTLRAFLRDHGASLDGIDALVWERYAPVRRQDPFTADERHRILRWFHERRPSNERLSLELRFVGLSPSEVRGLNVGDLDRTTGTLWIRRSRHLGAEGATKTVARERVVALADELAAEVATCCGIRSPDAPLIDVSEDTLRDNFTKAQVALGIRPRSLYQAKHTYAVLELLGGESPSTVARHLGISLATLEKHYAAALQRGRVLTENPRRNPRRRTVGRKYAK